jgi:hypothetical protein
MNDFIYRKIDNPIGYGWCIKTARICVFDHSRTVTCPYHPSTCGKLTKPHFIKHEGEEWFNAQKTVEDHQVASKDPDPNAHQ